MFNLKNIRNCGALYDAFYKCTGEVYPIDAQNKVIKIDIKNNEIFKKLFESHLKYSNTCELCIKLQSSKDSVYILNYLMYCNYKSCLIQKEE